MCNEKSFAKADKHRQTSAELLRMESEGQRRSDLVLASLDSSFGSVNSVYGIIFNPSVQ